MANTEFKINGRSVDVLITEKVLPFVIQGDCEKDGKGVFQGYSQNELAAAYVRIPKPTYIQPYIRALGSNVNGGSFSNFQMTIQNDEYQLPVTAVSDVPIIIALNDLSMVPQLKIENWAGLFAQNVVVAKNGMCLGTKFYKSFYQDKDNAYIETFDPATQGSIKPALDRCEDDLNEGIPSLGIDSFPDEGRKITFVTGITPYMRELGAFIVGGSNYAQEMLKSGAVSPNDSINFTKDGFRGIYGTVEMNLISPLKVLFADSYLGFPKGTLVACGLSMVESTSYANQFGLVDNGVKAVPAQAGQGTVLQPNYRMGAVTLFSQGNAFIMKAGYVNPYDAFTDIFTAVTPTVNGLGSRLEEFKSLITSSASTKFTVNTTYTKRSNTEVSPNTSANSDVGYYAYFVADSALSAVNLATFITAYKAASVKAVLAGGTIGTEQTVAGATTGKHVYVASVTTGGQISDIAHIVI